MDPAPLTAVMTLTCFTESCSVSGLAPVPGQYHKTGAKVSLKMLILSLSESFNTLQTNPVIQVVRQQQDEHKNILLCMLFL